MAQSTPGIRVSVNSADEVAAISHLKARGFFPSKIEKRNDGTVVLYFAPSSEQVIEFSQALPNHLNPKMGITSGVTVGK